MRHGINYMLYALVLGLIFGLALVPKAVEFAQWQRASIESARAAFLEEAIEGDSK